MRRLPSLGWLSFLLIVGSHSFMDALAEEDQVAQYTHRVVSTIRFDRQNFTQGLEIYDNRLYVSSGLYGQSAIRIYDFPSMQLVRTVPVDSRLFAEGLTIVNDHLLLLSWRERVMLIYALPDMTVVERSPLPGQGWGATHDDQALWFSDGSDQLYSRVVSDEGLGQIATLSVTMNGEPLRNLNELEWVNGLIWANLWQSDRIAQIDPETGKVVGLIHLDGLLPKEDRLRDTDVLNGIAMDPQTGQIWVTGKRWPWLFEIALEKANP
jgi:glutamine cyclotransferase